MRVAIAEDSVLLREGLARLLDDAGFEVVAQCGDTEQLMLKVRSYDCRPPSGSALSIPAWECSSCRSTSSSGWR
jgi:hypothetical protein